MRFLEFGNSINKKMILIHGFQVPWQVWKPQIDYFSQRFYVIVPILDGHDPIEKSTFISVQKAAKDIEKYYIEYYGNNIFAICGMSMGGSIASLLWANDKIHIEKLFLEGAPLVPQNKVLTALFIHQYISLTRRTQQRDIKTLNMCEKSFIPKNYMNSFLEMMDAMTNETIKNSVTSVGQFLLPKNLKRDNIEVIYYHGTTLNELLAKKSAKYLRKHYPQAKIVCLREYSHCELVLRHPERYIKLVEDFLEKT